MLALRSTAADKSVLPTQPLLGWAMCPSLPPLRLRSGQALSQKSRQGWGNHPAVIDRRSQLQLPVRKWTGEGARRSTIKIEDQGSHPFDYALGRLCHEVATRWASTAQPAIPNFFNQLPRFGAPPTAGFSRSTPIFYPLLTIRCATHGGSIG